MTRRRRQPEHVEQFAKDLDNQLAWAIQHTAANILMLKQMVQQERDEILGPFNDICQSLLTELGQELRSAIIDEFAEATALQDWKLSSSARFSALVRDSSPAARKAIDGLLAQFSPDP